MSVKVSYRGASLLKIHIPRNIEENGLEEEGEADPLVVFVILSAGAVSMGGGDTGMGNISSYLAISL